MKRLINNLLVIFMLASMIGVVVMYDQDKADWAVEFYSSLKHTKGKYHGKPFTLLPWEEKIVRDVYGTVKEDGTRQYKYIYIEIPKKNGKSEFGAAAANYSLYADGEMGGEVYSCAGNREQAGIVFDVAKEMVMQSPALLKRSRITGSDTGSTKAIYDLKSNSKYKVLSAEAFSKHGYNISCCVFDELHAQPNRKLWDVMTSYSGVGREQPLWWVLTTAGDDPDRESIGWEVHEYAMKVLNGEVIDPTWYVVIYSYDGDDIYNEENWIQANPGLGHNLKIDDMREDAVRAKYNLANERNFRWLRLNQWPTIKLTSWLPLDLWDQTIGQWTVADQIGKICFIGLDLSSTTDLTGLCALFPPQGIQLDWRAIWKAFIPEDNMRERIEKDHVDYDKFERAGSVIATAGNVIDYWAVKAQIMEWVHTFKVQEICLDRSFAVMLIQELEKADLECIDVPQTYAVLTNPMNTIETLMKTPGKFTHENNLTARWCFGNTSIAKNGNEQIKYVKEHKGKSIVRTKRIDLTAAEVIAMARAQFFTFPVDLSETVKKGFSF